MARPPERYEPGELESTRRHLGDLSPAEARTMAEKLGGEVGVERTPDAVEEEYDKLRQKATEFTEKEPRRQSRFVPASPAYRVVRSTRPERILPKMRWRERVKTDFYSARHDLRLKTKFQAWQTVFSLLRLTPDFVNPHFLIDSDHLLFRDLESLVLSVRSLSSPQYKNAHQNLRRIPLYNDIIHILRSWDIEAISQELTKLQRMPRGRSFGELETLAKLLMTPLLKLSRLNMHLHLLPALTKMYEFARLYVVVKLERERLLTWFSVAREALPLTFQNLRHRLHPVLLKMLCSHFLDEDAFYVDMQPDLLALAGLTEADLLVEAPARSDTLPPADSTDEEESDSSEEEAPQGLGAHGFELLDQIFPRAGWLTLEKKPDLVAYFQPLVEFPKGAELLPQDDPLHTILPLSEVLQQLFFGFQSFRWGAAREKQREGLTWQERVDKSIARWHFFINEFFSKSYLPQLQDYCREIERSLPRGSDIRRREHQMLWVKRQYMLPHLNVPILEEARAQNLGYPSLAVQVKEMIELLSPVAVEIERRPPQPLYCLNPDDRVQFPVETPIAARFMAVMRRVVRPESGGIRIIDQATNRGLLYVTLSLLSTLDYLLSAPDNLLYRRPLAKLYRTSGRPYDDKPVYNVAAPNTVALLKKLNELQPPEASEAEWTDRLKELYGPFLVQEDLKQQIQKFHEERLPFSVVYFRAITGENTRLANILKSLKDSRQTVSRPDANTFLLVFPEQEEDEAEDAARRILVAAANSTPPMQVAAFVVPYQNGWSLERLLASAGKGWAVSQEIPPQILGIWSSSLQIFEFRTDLPTVAS